ncbi:MAG: hypothetical protein ABEI96_10505 [Haloarculaceae archaeon]
MRVYVGPTVLYDLGQVGETDLLGVLDGEVVVPEAVAAEVTVEPARRNLERARGDEVLTIEPVETDLTERATSLLGESELLADGRLVEAVLAAQTADEDVGVVSADRRVRAVADGLGATVTGTFGVVVRAAAADKYLSRTQAKRIVRRLDSHGLHLTGELRERAVGAGDA